MNAAHLSGADLHREAKARHIARTWRALGESPDVLESIIEGADLSMGTCCSPHADACRQALSALLTAAGELRDALTHHHGAVWNSASHLTWARALELLRDDTPLGDVPGIV